MQVFNSSSQVRRRICYVPKLFALVCLASVCLVSAPATGQDDTAVEVLYTETPTAAFCYGSITDADGKPINGAQLLLLPSFSGSMEPFFVHLLDRREVRKASSNAGGQFAFELTVDESEFWLQSDYRLLASAEGYLTNVTLLSEDRIFVDAPLAFTLVSTNPTPLKLVDDLGQPIAGASVRVSRASGQRIAERIEELPTWKTDDDGEVSLPGYSADNLQEVVVRSDSIGIQRRPVETTEDGLLVRLLPTGRVNGQLKLQGDSQSSNLASLAGQEIWLTSTNALQYVQDGPATMSWCKAVLESDGSFQADNLVHGSVYYHFPSSDSFPFVPDRATLITNAELKPGLEPLELELVFEPARKVVFQFLGEDEQPISQLDVVSTTARDMQRADQEGRVEYWFKEGASLDGQLFAYDRFSRYTLEPFGVTLVKQKPLGPNEAEPIRLARAVAIRGRVLDEAGMAVPNADIEASYSAERFTLQKKTVSDARGNYLLRGLPAGATVSLKARKEAAMTPPDQPLQANAGSMEPVNIEISPQEMARLTGTLLDAQGEPLANAKVTIERGTTRIKEGFSAEELGTAPLEVSPLVTTDERGRFTSDPIVNFGDRFRLTITAPGHRTWRTHFLNGAVRSAVNGELDLGQFRLKPKPAERECIVSVVDADGNSIEGASLVCVGPTSGRVAAQTNASGTAVLKLLDAPQMIAVQADGFGLYLDMVPTVASSMRLKLATQDSTAEFESLANFAVNEDELRNLAKQLLAPIPLQGATDSSFYRQMRYFSSMLLTDFEAFAEMMLAPDCPYEYRGQFALMNAEEIFKQLPGQSLELLKSQAQSAEMKASMLASLSLSLATEETELREELLGEAIVEVGNAAGSEKLIGVGYAALALALQGRLDAAEAVMQEAWEQSPELQAQIASGERKHDRAAARIFAPKLAWLDPELALRAIPLMADEREVAGLLSQAIVYLSLKNREQALQLARERDIKWAAGVENLFQFGGSWVRRDPALADWLEWLSAQLEPSAAQVQLLLSAARHRPADAQRLSMIRQAAKSWRDAEIDFWYHWSDPGKGVLEVLGGFDDLRAAELDALIFASLQQGPSQFDSFNPLSVLANTARLISLRDPDLCHQVLSTILDDCDWMFTNGRYQLDSNLIVGATMWGRPYQAIELLEKLEDRLVNDDEVTRLQLRAAMIEEIKTLINSRASQ